MPKKNNKNKKTAHKASLGSKVKSWFTGKWRAGRDKLKRYMAATPHRTFRLTKKRDLPRAVKLPGYFSFSHEVLTTFREHRMPLLKLVLITWAVSVFMVGVAQQSRYADMNSAVQAVGQELMGGKLDATKQVATLFLSVASGTLNSSLSESQQIYLALLYLLVWLTTIWLLRHLLSGSKVSVRDGLYNAGAPLVSVVLIVFVALLQLLPGALAVMALSLAQQNGLLVSGIEVGAFSIAALLLVVLSSYWLTSTFFAIIVATIPGTYPVAAMRAARQLVLGQRRQILFRLLWLVVGLLLLNVLVLVPAIAIDTTLQFSSYPFMTLIFQLVVSLSMVYASTYIYLLYRKIIDGRS